MFQHLKGTALAAAAIALSATSASAHMTFVTDVATPGEEFTAVLHLPHGCDGAATDAVRVSIPDGFYGVRVLPLAGWAVAMTEGAYGAAVATPDGELTGGVVEIAWSGGSVADDASEDFAFIGTFAEGLSDGLVFPVEQMCGEESVVWSPAVFFSAEAATAAEHSDAASGAMQTVGDLAISGPFTRATLPNAQVGGGYLTIENTGTVDDRLVSATSDLAGEVQVHEMSIENDVMQMRQLADGIVIPAGETVELAPGGLHLMFMAITAPFVEGATVPVTLVFENAGAVDIELAVGAFGAAASSGHEGQH